MAAATIHVDVVSAEESVYSGEAEFVVLPGEAGELGIYPRHTPLITRIRPGTVRIKPAGGGEEQLIFVAGGILEVQPKVITVLADTAIRGKDLDEAKASEALRQAEEAIFSGDAEFVVLPGVMGELGIYPRHTPLITRIRPGVVRIKMPGKAEEEQVFVAGGILEVQPNVVTVLADTAIRGHDLDEAKARDALAKAEEARKNAGSELEIAKVEAEMSALAAQLAAIRKLRGK